MIIVQAPAAETTVGPMPYTNLRSMYPLLFRLPLMENPPSWVCFCTTMPVDNIAWMLPRIVHKEVRPPLLPSF